jgi:hypothetical protein
MNLPATPRTPLLVSLGGPFLALCLSCGGETANKPATGSEPATAGTGATAATGEKKSSPTEAVPVDDGHPAASPESARALVARLADEGTRSATVLALEPSAADYVAVYGEGFGKHLESVYSAAWKKHEIVPSPWGPDQTEVQLSRGTAEDFKAWQGEARKFPRGYKRIAEFMQPGLVFYQFRFVKPGQGAGANWDGLVWVNGAWKLFPKPFKAADEGSEFYRQVE